MSKESDLEKEFIDPRSISLDDFNSYADLPYGITCEHIYHAMKDYLEFLRVTNEQLNEKGIGRLETLLGPGTFSGMVADFLSLSLPKYNKHLVRNMFYNGFPTLIPAGLYEDNAVRSGHEGIEIAASRYFGRWQSSNTEEMWLMAFIYDSNRPVDPFKNISPFAFSFKMVMAAKISKDNWNVGQTAVGRVGTLSKAGIKEMLDNWVYKTPDIGSADGNAFLKPRFP